jgi:hypothetical protein
VLVAEQKWKSLQPPHRPLLLDELGEWLAARVGLEYYHIDPLKIDFTAVTDVMSSAYATRFGILPMQVTPARSSWRPPSRSCATGKRRSRSSSRRRFAA